MRAKSSQHGLMLWTVNPFQDSSRTLKNAARILELLAGRTGMAALPVFVATPAEANLTLEFSIPAKERMSRVATEAGRKILKKFMFPALRPLRVLVENHLRLSAGAARLAREAQAVKAELILCGTQTRGWERWVLGSFASALLAVSKVGIVFVNPRLRKNLSFRRLLFATDFSKESLRAFEKFCVLAQKLGAEVDLFHVLAAPYRWAFSVSAYLFQSRALSAAQYLAQVKAEAREAAEPFLRLAARRHLKLNLHLQKSSADISTAILREARRLKIDLIGMVARSGKWEELTIGTASQGVLREASVPLWLWRG
ncbi:MAG TPA: hypothetical protein DF383_06040 [Deltaproteobacteria bacterium]|nr:hypothetical protein [Deltaproteobacteria bacterium]